jgi:pyruvate kinase
MIMLSDETAMGQHPLEAVKILKRVIDRTEASIYKHNIIE